MFLQLVCQFGGGCVARGENNECFDDLTTHFIGTGDDRGLCNGGLLLQRAFYFEWGDAIARADNDVIRATHKPEVAILLPVGTGTRAVPNATNTGVCGLGGV